MSAAQKIIECLLTKGSELMQEQYIDGKKVPHVSKTITDMAFKALDLPKDNCVVVDVEEGLDEDDEPVSARQLVLTTLVVLCFMILKHSISCLIAKPLNFELGASESPRMDGRANTSQVERNTLYNRVNVKHWAAITQVKVDEQELEEVEQFDQEAAGLFPQPSCRSVESEHVRQFFEKQ